MKKIKQKHGGAIVQAEKGETANPNGRPRMLVGEVSKQLEAKGIKPAKAEQIRAIFMQFVNMPEKDLKEVMSDASQPMINRIVVKAMLGGKGFEVIKDLIERAHGKANQSIDIKQNEGIQIHIHNASKEYDLNPDGTVTKR